MDPRTCNGIFADDFFTNIPLYTSWLSKIPPSWRNCQIYRGRMTSKRHVAHPANWGRVAEGGGQLVGGLCGGVTWLEVVFRHCRWREVAAKKNPPRSTYGRCRRSSRSSKREIVRQAIKSWGWVGSNDNPRPTGLYMTVTSHGGFFP